MKDGRTGPLTGADDIPSLPLSNSLTKCAHPCSPLGLRWGGWGGTAPT